MLLSIRQYVIVFSFLIISLSSAFIYKIQQDLQTTRQQITRSQQLSASEELKQAIDTTLEKIKNSAISLSQWQEVKQQVENPEIFAYWYNVRFKKHAFDFQKYTSDLMIYDINGLALSKLDDVKLPYKIKTQADEFRFHIIENNQLIYIIPIYNVNNGRVDGYLSSKIQFLPLLLTSVHFRNLAIDSLSIKKEQINIEKKTLKPDDFNYKLNNSEGLTILEKQIRNSLLKLIIFIVIPTIIIFIALIFFISKPIKRLADYINNLRALQNNPTEAVNTQAIKIKELKEIYDSLYKYHIELTHNREHLSLTLNSIGDAVITTNANYEIIRMNPVAEKITGWDFLSARTHPLDEVFRIYNDEKNDSVLTIENLIPNDDAIPAQQDARLFSRTDKSYQIAYTASPILDKNGSKQGLVLVFNDITQQKLKDEQLQQSQKMDALGKLTGGIAHDFNNMLGVILGYSELLTLSTEKDSNIRQYAEEINMAGERARKLTSKLLAFSRTSTHEQQVADINELILTQQHMLKTTLTAKIHLDFQLGDKLWPIRIDTNNLQDAILNICINSMHAMPNGGHLTIKTCNIHFDGTEQSVIDLKPGDYVQICITDNGTGMDKQTRQKIFEPFFTTKGEHGTGLGLSQVYGFINQSGGSIHVYSEPGTGTAFSIYLPRYLEDSDQDETALSDDNEIVINNNGNETVLVVDDEKALTTLTCQILKDHGYRTFHAFSGPEALTILEQQAVDLLISDVIMPEMDGYQLAEIIREKYPEIKIQMISGFNERQGNSERPDTLSNNQLNKPFSANELLSSVRRTLDA